MNVRVELVAREVPAEAAGSSPRISGTGSKHTSRVTLGRTHFESNVSKCSKMGWPRSQTATFVTKPE